MIPLTGRSTSTWRERPPQQQQLACACVLLAVPMQPSAQRAWCDVPQEPLVSRCQGWSSWVSRGLCRVAGDSDGRRTQTLTCRSVVLLGSQVPCRMCSAAQLPHTIANCPYRAPGCLPGPWAVGLGGGGVGVLSMHVRPLAVCAWVLCFVPVSVHSCCFAWLHCLEGLCYCFTCSGLHQHFC